MPEAEGNIGLNASGRVNTGDEEGYTTYDIERCMRSTVGSVTDQETKVGETGRSYGPAG